MIKRQVRLLIAANTRVGVKWRAYLNKLIMKNNISEKQEVDESIEGDSWIKVRYVQIALLFFSMVILFNIRICLSVGIVAMTTNNTSSNPNVPTYNWGNSNIILSSFFWSYAILQFFAGNLAHYFGTIRLLFATVFVNSLASILIPVTAEYLGANGVMACRIIQGLFQGFLLPLINGVLGRWVPPNELSLLNGIVFSGATAGIMSSMVITGYFSASDWGWPAAFYFFGILGFIWCIFWVYLSAETPATHKTISIKERKYIEHSLGQQDDHLIDKKSVPWADIFKSLPYWAIIIAAIGESWCTTLLNSELPSYLSRAVGLNIQESSLFSAAPVGGALITGLCCGPIAGLMINRGCTTKATARKIFHAFGCFTMAIGLILLSYIEEKILIAVLLIGSVSASHTVILGHLVNHVDISPRYAAVLSGISNGTGQMVAIFAPILVHFVVYDETDKKLWRSMFIVAAVINILAASFFVLFCSGERQWWDDVDRKKLNRKNETDLPTFGEVNTAFENDIVK